jgi:hypothetical protein
MSFPFFYLSSYALESPNLTLSLCLLTGWPGRGRYGGVRTPEADPSRHPRRMHTGGPQVAGHSAPPF